MSKINQRVINLTKIDTKEKAFLVGCCSFNTEFPNLKKNLANNEIIIELDWIDDGFEDFKNFLVKFFDADIETRYKQNYADYMKQKLMKKNNYVDGMFDEWKYKKVLHYYVCHIKITDGSKHWFNGKLPTVKKELYNYLICGVFIKNGSYYKISNGKLDIWQFSTKHGLKLLKKQLENWYNIKNTDIETRDINGNRMNFLNIDAQDIERFYQIINTEFLDFNKNKKRQFF